MENIQLLLGGFSTLFTLNNVGAAMMGAVLGLIVGAMSGIGSLAGVALLLPLTYKFNPTTAIITLGALYYPNMCGGAFNAILLNIPGDSPAIRTVMDSYPMAAKKKRPGQALFIVNVVSFIGGIIGIIILISTESALANVGLEFNPSEITALLFVAMVSISWLVGGNPIKDVVTTMLGTLLVGVGTGTLFGSPRYDFGSTYLLGGIPPAPFTIGTMDFSQVTNLVIRRGADTRANHDMKLTIKGSLLAKHDSKRFLPPAVCSGPMDTLVGALPGVGAITSTLMGYAAQKKLKSEEELGAGATERIAAAEAADNAATAGALAPLLVLGIPGSGTEAVLLGGLMMRGLNPGPLLFTDEPEPTWGLITSLFLSNIFTLIASTDVIPFLIEMLSVPAKLMIPIIITVCVVGSYNSSYLMHGVIVMLLPGILGYILTKNGFPTTPMLFPFVLTKLLKSNVRKAFIISGGSLDIFFTRPITCVLIPIFLAFILALVIKAVIRKARSKA